MTDDLHRIEADDRLLPLLDQVAAEGELTITRGGEAVAKLVAVPHDAQSEARAAAEGLLALRAEIAARGERFTWEELKQWRDEGRGVQPPQ